mgnify:CR=1 FL=1
MAVMFEDLLNELYEVFELPEIYVRCSNRNKYIGFLAKLDITDRLIPMLTKDKDEQKEMRKSVLEIQEEFKDYPRGIYLPETIEAMNRPRNKVFFQSLVDVLQENNVPANDISIATFIILHEFGHLVEFNMVKDKKSWVLDYTLSQMKLRNKGYSDQDIRLHKEYRRIPYEVRADRYAVGSMKKLLELGGNVNAK